ncbi:MAG: hypothetical protein WCO56_19065 [Verrucomicrobiota bacterium]
MKTNRKPRAEKQARKRTTEEPIAGAKRQGRNRPPTGAPPADFLQHLDIDPVAAFIASEDWKKERQSLFGNQTNSEVFKNFLLALVELADRTIHPKIAMRGTEDTANDLASAAIIATQFLERVAAIERIGVSLAAMKHPWWPVLLGLGSKQDPKNPKGEPILILKRAEEAKEYLCQIKLGQSTENSIKLFGDPDASPFNKAAERLLQTLVQLRNKCPDNIEKITPWQKDLFALDYPMTKDNAERWWTVAKAWMVEYWNKTDGAAFLVLQNHCKVGKVPLADAPLYPSEKRRNIIDIRLREAFLALAK